MKMFAVPKVLFVLFILWGLTACETASDSSTSSDSSSSSNSSSSSSSSCSGSQTPYGDIQIDTQCQAACAYLEAGSTEGVDATCQILEGYESISADVRASDCPACGNSSGSTTSTGGSDWRLCTQSPSTAQCTTSSCSSGYTFTSSHSSQSSCSLAATAWRSNAANSGNYTLCTRETTTHVYYECAPGSSSCSSGYSRRSTHSSSGSCTGAGDSWLSSFSKPSAKLMDASGLSPMLKSMVSNWMLCVDYQAVSAVCSTQNVCAETTAEHGSYTSSAGCAESAEAWLNERQYTQPAVSSLGATQPKDSSVEYFSLFLLQPE